MGQAVEIRQDYQQWYSTGDKNFMAVGSRQVATMVIINVENLLLYNRAGSYFVPSNVLQYEIYRIT